MAEYADYFALKSWEIAKRESIQTDICRAVGVDMDGLGQWLHKMKMSNVESLYQIWNSACFTNESLNKIKELFLLLIFCIEGITRDKQKSDIMNDDESIPLPQNCQNTIKRCGKSVKELTIALSEKLPHQNGKIHLEKSVFVNQFYTYLYELHADYMDDATKVIINNDRLQQDQLIVFGSIRAYKTQLQMDIPQQIAKSLVQWYHVPLYAT
eukprot:305062_1